MNEEEEYFYDYACEQEKLWRASLPKFSDNELVKMFQPEVGLIIKEKLVEWQKERISLLMEIKRFYQAIKNKSPVTDVWFWELVLRKFTMPRLEEIDGHINRLQRQNEFASGKNRRKFGSNWFSKEDIERAKSVPIQNLLQAQTKLKKSGKNYFTLCPLHNEKTPSFYIYTDSNHFKCFGCQSSGNVINLVEKLYNYSFVEAIKLLLNHY